MTDAAQRIAALEAQVAALQAEMQDFTYTVSHDLRAPLRHIQSYVQLVHEDAAHLLPEEALGFLNTVTDSARHLGLLLDGLTELSRVGTAPLQCEPVQPLALVQDVVAELQGQHPDRAVGWQLPQDMPALWADAALLRRALLCVLDNALKFTGPRAQAHIALNAHTALAPDGRAVVVLQVQDNGVGFNAALQGKLFKPFQRLHTAKQFAGIGMGLALTHKIATRLGGQVQAQPLADGGCQVTLWLPGAPA